MVEDVKIKKQGVGKWITIHKPTKTHCKPFNPPETLLESPAASFEPPESLQNTSDSSFKPSNFTFCPPEGLNRPLESTAISSRPPVILLRASMNTSKLPEPVDRSPETLYPIPSGTQICYWTPEASFMPPAIPPTPPPEDSCQPPEPSNSAKYRELWVPQPRFVNNTIKIDISVNLYFRILNFKYSRFQISRLESKCP